jgi:hypothetical protein
MNLQANNIVKILKYFEVFYNRGANVTPLNPERHFTGEHFALSS